MQGHLDRAKGGESWCPHRCLQTRKEQSEICIIEMSTGQACWGERGGRSYITRGETI